MTSAKRKVAESKELLDSITFRVDFAVSLSEHGGDPSDYIAVYEGYIVGMADDECAEDRNAHFVHGRSGASHKRGCIWARGYFVSTVGRDETTIREYIRNQEQEDKRLDQLNMWR